MERQSDTPKSEDGLNWIFDDIRNVFVRGKSSGDTNSSRSSYDSFKQALSSTFDSLRKGHFPSKFEEEDIDRNESCDLGFDTSEVIVSAPLEASFTTDFSQLFSLSNASLTMTDSVKRMKLETIEKNHAEVRQKQRNLRDNRKKSLSEEQREKKSTREKSKRMEVNSLFHTLGSLLGFRRPAEEHKSNILRRAKEYLQKSRGLSEDNLGEGEDNEDDEMIFQRSDEEVNSSD